MAKNGRGGGAMAFWPHPSISPALNKGSDSCWNFSLYTLTTNRQDHDISFFSISQKMEDTLCIWHCSLVVKSLYWSFEIRSMQCLIIRLTYSPVLGVINDKYFSQTYSIIHNRFICCIKSKWCLWIQQTKKNLVKSQVHNPAMKI